MLMKKIVVRALALSLLASLALAGCAKKPVAKMIGLAMPETHVERWQKDGASLKADAEAAGYRAEVTYGDADQAKQNQQIQDMLTKGAKLLVIGSVNEGVIPVVADAAKEKVIVIAYDRLITGSGDYDYYITFDNFKVGQLQGKALEAALNLPAATKAAPKNITLFAGSPTDNNAKVFFDGAMSVLKSYVDSGAVKLVGPAPLSSADPAFTKITTENWMAPVAKTRMENLLANDARNVVLDAVLAPNDTLARAIIEACKADAKYRTKLPMISGQDAEIASVKLIADDVQFATIFKDTRKLAEQSVVAAQAFLAGETPEANDTETYDNGVKVVPSYLLESDIVYAGNIQALLVDSGYWTADEVASGVAE